jgi:hypothetical protein
MQSRKRKAGAVAAIVAAAALVPAAFAAPASAALVDHDGKVLSKESKGTNSFRIKDDETGEKIRFRVNSNTRFERIPGGFSGLRRGLVISVDGHTRANGFVADEVEQDRPGGNEG